MHVKRIVTSILRMYNNAVFLSDYVLLEVIMIRMCEPKLPEKVFPNYSEMDIETIVYQACRYCEKCGSEMYWPASMISVFLKQIKDEELAEIENYNKEFDRIWKNEILSITTCPVCGAALRDTQSFLYTENWLELGKGEYYSASEHEKLILDDFKEMRKEREEEFEQIDEELSNKMIDEFFEEEEMLAVNSVIEPLSDIPSDLKNSTDGLKKYFKQAIDIEQSIYSLENRIKQIIQKMPRSERLASVAIFKTNNDSDKAKRINNEYELEKKRIEEDNFGIDLAVEPIKPSKPQEPIAPVHETAGLFNRKKVQEQNAALDAQYAKELEAYNKELEEYNKEVVLYEALLEKTAEENKHRIASIEEKRQIEIKHANEVRELAYKQLEEELKDVFIPEAEMYKLVKGEYELASKAYRELLIFKERFYQADIIFEKYRNMPAVTTIYEYLMAGRCSHLEGTDGAYNLYESELRANTIISKLDVVIEKLEEIKQAQYMLCSILQRVSTTLRSIDKKLDTACESLSHIDESVAEIKKTSEIIADNTAVTAYFAEQTAYYSKITAMVNVASYLGL